MIEKQEDILQPLNLGPLDRTVCKLTANYETKLTMYDNFHDGAGPQSVFLFGGVAERHTSI